MTTIVTVPTRLDEFTFEQVIDQVARVPAEGKLLVDARGTVWASPFGLCALLALGEARATRPEFVVPEAADAVSYWARAGFFRLGEPFYHFVGAVPSGRSADDSATLLPITRIAAAGDIHEVVDGIQEAAQRILTEQLDLGPSIAGFMMSLSESCQNVVEHAGRGGWVMAQAYRYTVRPPKRRVVQIAVCDAGIGFKESLGPAHARRFGERWDDARALEEAVVRAVSRFRDPGRGQGLAGIRRFIGRWEGKLTVRSGTARIGVLPPWDDDVPLQADLPYFPGAQVLITIPAKGTHAR